ncbi:MAG: ATP-dependent DNA helicase, partial [Gammaproteobacteria bacterium]|nr:ATP-dependent DNA helicase [Gammaproteobacteria bacterium]
MLTLTEVLGTAGPLAGRVPGFHARAAQQAMAEEVARTLDEQGILLCEAGTGTGKTFAYLAPALLADRRVVISTGTRNLQDQLFHRDLPLVRDALAVPVHAALLKGRANYLCLQRLQQHTALPFDGTDEIAGHLESIRAWAGVTRTGDRAELAAVPEASPAWRLATSTSDNCLGSECPHYEDCFLLKARREAQDADVVVVNHHLLFADMQLRQEGFGELLPGAEAIIVDEAHQLPELATRAFGTTLASGQLAELARDAARAYESEAGDVPGFTERTRALAGSVDALRDVLAERLAGAAQRLAWDQIGDEPVVTRAVAALAGALEALDEALAPLAERGRQL